MTAAVNDPTPATEQTPVQNPVLAAGTWPTNGHLIADVARLGYLQPDLRTLDPTYGRGRWWTRWRPDDLVTHHRPTDGSDFRKLPHPDASFDAIAYDPPYVCAGGRTTTSISDMHDRYGQTDAPTTTRGVQALINDGLTEMARIARPGGIVLVKCQDYVSSGALWLGTHHTLSHGLTLDLRLKDRLEHVTNPRPQPGLNKDGSPRRQLHARRNLSTLLVFTKPGRRS